MSGDRGIALGGIRAALVAQLDVLSVAEPTTHRALTEAAWRWCEYNPGRRLFGAHVMVEEDAGNRLTFVRVKAKVQAPGGSTADYEDRLAVLTYVGLPADSGSGSRFLKAVQETLALFALAG